VTPTASGVDVTLSLQEGNAGYTGGRDTYMEQYSANSNYAALDSFRVGYKRQSAGLLAFDLSPVPRSASVVSAVLQVYAIGWGGGDISIGAYAVLRDMVTAEATWNHSNNAELWGLGGCNDTLTDRRETAESTVATSGINKWYSFDVTALVQEWVSGGLDNNGLLLMQTTTASYRFVFAAAQKGDASIRPKLVVTYR